MLGIKIFQKIFIYTIILIGTIIILGIIAASGFLYFKNEWIVSNINTINNNFQQLLTNVETNINQTLSQISNLVGVNGSEGEIQKNISNIIMELQKLQQNNPGINFNTQIQQLQDFKNNVIGSNLSTLVSNVQSATENALTQIKTINNSYINPTINWFISDSKKVALIVFIVSDVVLVMSIVLTIIVKSARKKVAKE